MKNNNLGSACIFILALAFLVSNGSGTQLYKRSQSRYEVVTSGGVAEFQQKFLQLFNQYRSNQNLPPIVLDPTLTRGAQEWAESVARTGELAHSCTRCEEFAEILAKRRSARKLPEGVEAAEWAFESWFDEEDDTYDAISKSLEITKVGVGIAYIRRRDRSYHAYAVARFSK